MLNEKYIPLVVYSALSVLLCVVIFFLMRGFLVIIFFAFVLAALTQDFHQKIKRRIKSDTLTSFLIFAMFVFFLLTPFVFIVLQILEELKDFTFSVSFFLHKLETELAFGGVSFDLQSRFAHLLGFFNNFLESFIFSLPDLFVEFVLILFFYFYFSRNYQRIVLFLKSTIFNRNVTAGVNKQIHNLLNSVFYGQILVRLIQSFSAIIILGFLGVSNFFLWGSLIFFVSFLPIVGSGLVLIPLVVVSFVSQDSYWITFFLILGSLFISVIDNLIAPFLISSRTNINSIFVLVSILGGFNLFGFYGLFLGPFLLGVFLIFSKLSFFHLIQIYPSFQRFIWSVEEREKYRGLSKLQRVKFERKMQDKYLNLFLNFK